MIHHRAFATSAGLNSPCDPNIANGVIDVSIDLVRFHLFEMRRVFMIDSVAHSALLRIDHHCTILAACVGAGNHAQFWDYLLAETVTIGFWIAVVFKETFLDEKLPFLWGSATLLGLLSAIAVPGGLFVFHTFLALTNQTTWEVYAHSRVPYLKGIDEDVMPFDEGIRKNLFLFCVRLRKPRRQHSSQPSVDWTLPAPHKLAKKVKRGNCWNNQYYSCC